MFKKLFALLIVFIILIMSVGIISADELDIPVKVIWPDDDLPDYVTVELIKDGKTVDTAILNKTNSWKVTFKVNDSDDYQIKEIISDDYSFEITGDVEKGFTIVNKRADENVLGAVEDETLLEESAVDEKVSEEDNSIVNVDENTHELVNSSVNSTDDNSTDTNGTANFTDKNTTEEKQGNPVSKTTKTTKVTKTTKTTKVVKKDKPSEDDKSEPQKTGLPLAVLVCAVFAAAFIPFSRRK